VAAHEDIGIAKLVLRLSKGRKERSEKDETTEITEIAEEEETETVFRRFSRFTQVITDSAGPQHCQIMDVRFLSLLLHRGAGPRARLVIPAKPVLSQSKERESIASSSNN
jgi:hypothetical protein